MKSFLSRMGILLIGLVLLGSCGKQPAATSIPTAGFTPATSPRALGHPPSSPSPSATPTLPPVPTSTPTPTTSPTPTSTFTQTPTSTFTPTSTPTPIPLPTPTPSDQVRLYESDILIPTYPWRDFLTPAYDETVGWAYDHFDSHAYQSAYPQPTPQSYHLYNLENRWVRVNVMPELGGRVYQWIFKPTGSNEFYQNAVIKPSPWGPMNAGTGWLAAGGLEWGLPVPEHGYAWGQPWGVITLPGEDAQAVTVFTGPPEGVHFSATLTLQPDVSAWMLHLELENSAEEARPVSFWLDAMLAPGPNNTVGPNLRFFYPITQATVHSTGNPQLPSPGEVFDWPVYQGVDWGYLGHWGQWLGFFAHPQARVDWAAVYDLDADEGVVRIFPHNMAPGLKGFGFGWEQPIPADNYTDDGSAYVEMQGGVTPTYDTRLTLQPGDLYTWDEVWYPVAGLGGVSAANAMGAAHLTQVSGNWRLRVVTTRPMRGTLIVSDATGEHVEQPVSLAPNAPGELILPGNMQLPLTLRLGEAWVLRIVISDQ